MPELFLRVHATAFERDFRPIPAGWSSEEAATGDENMPAPPEHLTAYAASGAIILVATSEPDRATEMYLKFIETGVQIAQGKMRISP